MCIITVPIGHAPTLSIYSVCTKDLDPALLLDFINLETLYNPPHTFRGNGPYIPIMVWLNDYG
jgi:hypothetical protein